jgi:hypothetical protein
MSVLSLAASPAPALAQSTGGRSPANDIASAAASNPTDQVSLSLEAQLTVTVTQETKITISMGDPSGASSNASKSPDGSNPADPAATRALSTMEKIAADQRAWIKALEANRRGHQAPSANDAGDQGDKITGQSGDCAGADQAPSIQISIEQDTTVETRLSVGAQLDVSA